MNPLATGNSESLYVCLFFNLGTSSYPHEVDARSNIRNYRPRRNLVLHLPFEEMFPTRVGSLYKSDFINFSLRRITIKARFMAPVGLNNFALGVKRYPL